MIQDTAWSPRFVASTTATAATSADVNAGTDTNKFITPAALAGSSPTFGGNLTVGGTITLPSNQWISAAAGDLIRNSYFGYSTSYRVVQVGTTSGISLGADLTGNASGVFNGSEIVVPNNRALIAPNAANNGYVGVLRVGTDNKVYLGGNDYQTLGAVILNGTSAEVVGNLTVSGTGNSSVAGTLLVATTTNSSNGKLQLATHTTSAGGIGFGTDWALHRISSSYMGLTATGNATGTLSIGNSTNPASESTGVILRLSANDAYLWNYQNGTFYIGNNNGTALSFDSSRNATFAGNITASGSGDRSATVETTGSSNAALLQLKSGNGTTSARYAYLQLISNETSGQTWNVGMYNEKQFSIRDGSTPFLTIANSTGNATFAGSITTAAPTTGTAGAWKLGVRVAATTTLDTTQYLQVDVGGTLYKVALVTA